MGYRHNVRPRSHQTDYTPLFLDWNINDQKLSTSSPAHDLGNTISKKWSSIKGDRSM